MVQPSRTIDARLCLQVDSFIPLWGWDVPPPKKTRKVKKSSEKGAASATGATVSDGKGHVQGLSAEDEPVQSKITEIKED